MFKNKYILLVFFLLLQLNSWAQGIKIYTGTLADGKAAAKRENKYLIVDGYTDWCGWCKFMDKNIYPQKEVGDFFNAHFIFLQMDMEKGDGKEVARQYKLQMYPSFLFFDPEGAFVHYNFGASTTPQSFITLGQTAMDSLHNCRGLAYRFFKGDRDTAFLREMINTISYYADSKITEKALSAYWAALPDNQLIERESWNMFKYYEQDINSKAFNYFYEHPATFKERYRDKEDSNILSIKAAFFLKTASDSNNANYVVKARKIAMESHDKQTRYTACVNEMPYYIKNNKPEVFYSDVDQFIKAFGTDWVWGITSEMESATDNPKYLKKALELQSEALKTNNNYNNTETYARILFKLGRVKEAYASANDAATQANAIASNEEKARAVSEANSLVEKIKKSMDSKN